MTISRWAAKRLVSLLAMLGRSERRKRLVALTFFAMSESLLVMTMDKSQQLRESAKGMKPGHLKLAKALSEGKSQTEAYLIMGGKGKNPRDCASKLISTNLDIGQYAELAKEIQAENAQRKGIATFEDKAELLWRIAKDNSQGDTRASIAAMAELNKMSGDLAAIKSDLTVNAQEDWLAKLS